MRFVGNHGHRFDDSCYKKLLERTNALMEIEMELSKRMSFTSNASINEQTSS